MLRDSYKYPRDARSSCATVDEVYALTVAAWARSPVENLLTVLGGARALGEFIELADERVAQEKVEAAARRGAIDALCAELRRFARYKNVTPSPMIPSLTVAEIDELAKGYDAPKIGANFSRCARS